jgi:hypothetical protein
LDDDEEEKGE